MRAWHVKKTPALMNDILFQVVFGTERNEPLLRALLNALLGRTGDERITHLDILNPHGDKSHVQDRGVVLDVKARDGAGRLFNVEVQVTEEPDYVSRSLYYLARLFTEQLVKGDPFEQVNQTIAISLLDYNLFPDVEDLHSTYRFYDVAHRRELSDVLEIHYIELLKFKKDRPATLRTPFERWLHVLKFGELYARDLEVLPAELKREEGVEMAIERMRQARASDEVREMILVREMALHDEATRLSHARRKAAEEGRAEGAEMERRALARKLIDSGMDLQRVLELTDMRPEDLS